MTSPHHAIAGATLYILSLRGVSYLTGIFFGIVVPWPAEAILGVIGAWHGGKADLWDWIRWLWNPVKYPRWDNYYVDAHTPGTDTWKRNIIWPAYALHVWATDPSFHNDVGNLWPNRWKLPQSLKEKILWTWPKWVARIFGREAMRLWDLCYVGFDEGGIALYGFLFLGTG